VHIQIQILTRQRGDGRADADEDVRAEAGRAALVRALDTDNAAADERVDRVGLQKSGQRPVSAAHRVDDRRRDDPPVGHIIELELRRPPEMAVDLPVIKRYRKPHKDPSRLCSCAK